MGTSIKTANPNVSNTILKALGNNAKGQPAISNTEWTGIKRAALNEVKSSGNPTRTLQTVKASFELGNRATGGKYKEKFSDLVSTATTAADARKASLRQVDHDNWGSSGDTGVSGGTPT